jgi:hypothetical protein
MACKIPLTSRASVRKTLISKGVIDKYNNILNLSELRRLNALYLKDAKDRFGINEPLFYGERKVIFNEKVFHQIDFQKGIVYPDNEYLKLYQLTDVQPDNDLSVINSTLLSFAKKISPDFRVERIEDLSVNGFLDLQNFFIGYSKETAIPEEVSHIFVELLDRESDLYKDLLDTIVYTKIYEKTYQEYKNIYPDKETIKREAIAKLVSLYMTNPNVFESMVKDRNLLAKIKRLINQFINYILSKRDTYNKEVFQNVANQILSLNTDNLLLSQASDSQIMYQLSESDLLRFQTISTNPLEYDTVFLNLNDTIFDYKNYTIEDRESLQKEGKIVKGETIKKNMWTNPRLKDDLDTYWQNVRLTKLGRELKDKISVVDNSRKKFVFYTDAEISQSLLDRLLLDFGSIDIIRTSGEEIIGEDESGNPITKNISKKEKLINRSRGKSLFVDNRKSDLFLELEADNRETLLYLDSHAKYMDFREMQKRDLLESQNKEFTSAVLQEFDLLDKDNIVQLAKPALNLIRSILNKIENNESIEEVFKDEFGNLVIPAEKANLIKRQLEENGKDFQEGLLNFINTIGSATLFWKNANKTDFISLREKAKGNKDDIQQAIKDSASLMRMILQWEEWINSIQPVLSHPSFENSKVIKGVIADLSSTLSVAKDRINHISVEVLSSQLSDLGKNYNEGKLAALKAGFITQEQYERDIITPQKIANIIYGKEGDIGLISFFENPFFINNDLIQTISLLVEKGIVGANQKSLEKSLSVGRELWTLEEKIGLSSSEIGERITYIDQTNFFEEGEMKQRDTLTLLNPFKNRWHYKSKWNEVTQLKRNIYEQTLSNTNEETIERLREEYQSKLKEFKEWEKNNWHREMQTEVTEIYQEFGLLDGEQGKHLERGLEIQQQLWEEKKIALLELKQTVGVEQEILQYKIENLDKRLKGLRNPFSVDLNKFKEESENPEEDIRVATVLKKKHIIDRQLYNYSTDNNRFLSDLRSKILEISDIPTQDKLLSMIGSSETWLKELYQIAETIAPFTFIDWLDLNTKTVYSQSFYDTRKDTLRQIGETIEQIGVYYSDEQSREIQNLNKDLQSEWEDLFNISSSLRDEDGIFDASDTTLEHQKMVRSAEVKVNLLKENIRTLSKVDIDTLTPNEQVQFKALKNQLYLLLESLSNLQSKEPTHYYGETLYQKLKDVWPAENGKLYEHENFISLVNSEKFTKWLINAPSDFKEWFNTNHFLVETEEELNPETGERENVVQYKPTYIWMRIKPTDDNHILTVPNYKYSERSFKETVFVEYPDHPDKGKYFRLLTEKNEYTWDSLLNEWLPKSQEYRNEDYFKLQKENPDLFNYLSIVTKHHLEVQKEAPRDSKLGYVVPFMEKRFVDGGGIKSLWREFDNKLNPAEEGERNVNEGLKAKLLQRLKAFVGITSTDIEQSIVKTDLLGNPIKKVFTPYTIWTSPERVSRDLSVSTLHYSESLERTKALINNIPELNLLEQLLEQYNPFEKNLVNTKGERVSASSNRMLEVVRNIKNTKIFGDFKEYELGQKVDEITLKLRKNTTFFSQSIINPANALKNWLQGQFTNIISGTTAGWTTEKNLMKAMKSPKTSFMKFTSELGNKEKSLDFQIISLFNLTFTNHISQMFTSTGFKRTLQGNFFYLSSEATEFSVISSLLYGHLWSKKITNNLGETKDLYDVFYLDNGVLKIKEGWKDKDSNLEINQDYINDLIIKSKNITEQIQGKQWNAKIADRYTLWKNFEFFKQYFIPKLRERFAKGRKNISIGDDLEGYYITTFKRFMREIISFLEEGRFSGVALSPMEKQARRLMSKELLVMLSTYLFIAFVFGFDDDDKDRYKKLKENSWAENFMLMVLLNAKKETDSASIIPLLNVQENLTPPLLNETYNYVKEPFIGFGLVDDSKKLVNTLFNHITDNNAYYDKDLNQYFIEKNESKFGHQLLRLTLYDDLMYLANPNYKIQVQQQSALLN